MLNFLNDLLTKTKEGSIKWTYDATRKAYKTIEPYKMEKENTETEFDVYLHFTTEQLVELIPVGQDHIQENMKKTHRIGGNHSSKVGSQVGEIYDSISLLNIEKELVFKPIPKK